MTSQLGVTKALPLFITHYSSHDVAARCDQGFTAIHYALFISWRRSSVWPRLYRYSLRIINLMTSQLGVTKALPLFITHYSSHDVAARCDQGFTAIHYALFISWRRSSMWPRLYRYSLRIINLMTSQLGVTKALPLFITHYSSHDVAARCDQGFTAIHYALFIWWRRSSVWPRLYRYSLRIIHLMTSQLGVTKALPLCITHYSSHDVAARCDQGLTAIHYALLISWRRSSVWPRLYRYSLRIIHLMTSQLGVTKALPLCITHY